MAEMLQCVAASASDLLVLERQRARLQWQQQPQQSLNYITNTNLGNDFGGEALLSFPLSQNAHHPGGIQPSCERELLGGLGLRWPDLSSAGYPTLGIGQGEYIGTMITGKDQSLEAPATQRANPSPKQSCSNTSSSLKKRKADNPPVTKTEDSSAEKRMKGTDQQAMMPEPKLKADQTNNTKSETSGESLKENSKTSAPPKTDYIHVRARRGQATDSHSLAERVRREKISERMRYLQDLVPGCNKITGKAGMLDEIINYVQSLQRQVEFLSMKLAAVNPSLDFNIDSFFGKEMNPSCSTGISTVGMSCNLINPSYLQLNSLQQTAVCCGINMAMTPQELVLPRSMKAPVPVPDTFVDPSLNVMAQGASSAWDIDLQSLYNMELHQGNRPAFPLQSFHGSLLPNNPKMEM